MERSTPPVRWRTSYAPLFGILAVFVLLSLVYNAAVPLGEGPDEPGHFRYVLFLAREHRLPVQRPAPQMSDVPGEGHQPPFAYLLATPAVAWLAPDAQRITLRENPAFVWNGGDAPGAFVRGSQERWPWRSTTLAWHLARGVSLLWGIVTVAATWAIARSITKRRGVVWLATSLVACNPQFLFTTALVTNDVLLAALSAVILWLVLRPPARSSTVVPSLLVGALFGLALLTKQSALLLGPLLVWASWRNGNTWRVRLASMGLWGGAALLVAGWWYGRNWLVYGDPLGLAAFSSEFATQAFDWRNLATWRTALVQLTASFWARFGWMSLEPPPWVTWNYSLLGLLGVVGLLATWRPTHPCDGLRSAWIGLVLLVVLALAWTLSFALTAGLVAWQGRFLFPALPAIAIVLARGLVGLGELGRLSGHPRSIAVGSAVAGLAVLALWLPLGVVAPAYTWRTSAPAVATANLGNATYARFAQPWERGVELRGWRIAEPVQVGDSLRLTLTWHALEPVPRDWTVFVHLVDGAETIVAKNNSRPQSGQFPMPLWTHDDWVVDQHTLDVPADTPPGTYRLRVGLYLPRDRDKRQGVWTENDVLLGDYVELGTVEVTARATMQPTPGQ